MVDYSPVAGNFTFNSAKLRECVMILIIDNQVYEGSTSKEFTVQLSVNDNNGNSQLEDTAVISIKDNEKMSFCKYDHYVT